MLKMKRNNHVIFDISIIIMRANPVKSWRGIFDPAEIMLERFNVLLRLQSAMVAVSTSDCAGRSKIKLHFYKKKFYLRNFLRF